MKLILPALAGLVLISCQTSPAVSSSPLATPAATAVARAADPLVAQLATETTKAAAREQLLARGKSAVPLLIADIAHENGHVRWEIVDLLGQIGDAGALDALTQRALKDGNPHVRWRSMWAMSRIASNDVARTALQAGLAGDTETRWNAAVALSFFDSAEGITILHDAVRTPDPFRRWEAINALGRVHDAKSVDVLAMALRSPSARDRNEVVLTLGNIGGAAANALLIDALSDEAPSVRWRAAMALGKAGTATEITALRHVASADTDPEVREHAAKAINRIEQRKLAR